MKILTNRFESGSTELEESIRELIHYLTRMRNKTTLELTDNNNKKKSVKASVEVLDTTLVKCYLKVSLMYSYSYP